MRNFRQALASPHSGLFFSRPARDTSGLRASGPGLQEMLK